MKDPFLRATSGFILASVLTGCISINVNEERVFKPREAHFVSVATGLKIRNEKALIADGISLEHLTLPTSFGNIAVTRAQKSESNTGLKRPLILMCMGTSGERYRSGRYYLSKAIEYGDVILFDYPGYNDSDGDVSVPNFQETAAAMSQYMSSLNISDSPQSIAWGHSLGGFVCSEIVRQNPNFNGIIIEASAQNIDKILKERIPLIAKPFVKAKVGDGLQSFDIAHSLKEFDKPILVLGASKDKVLDVKLSQKLVAALDLQGNQVNYVEFKGAGHSSIYKHENFNPTMTSFIDEVLTRP